MGDTIAAIATGVSNAGIGIIRISGDEAVFICDKIYRGKQSLLDVESHTIVYGHIIDIFNNNNVVDEVLVSIFIAPKSYTRENVVEISSHGGILVMRNILELVFKAGAKPAQPGEFTKRAFLNGRIDLSQAESVMDIISSENEKMLDNSLKQLDGRFSGIIKELRDDILHECAYIESALDDPEHFELSSYGENLAAKINNWKIKINSLIESFNEGKIIRDGIKTVIAGKPNAGKSSLLNAFAREERAIVTSIPGTTRDTINEKIKFGEYILDITDTAGIRESDNEIERIGVDKSLEAINDADLILYMVDINDSFNDEDENIISIIDEYRTILIINKTDIYDKDEKASKEFLKGFPKSLADNHVFLSVKKHDGFDKLYEHIKNMFINKSVNVDRGVDFVVTNERHLDLLRACGVSLSMVDKSISDGMPEDFYMVDLMDSYKSLGLIIGEETEDDLVDRIFSEFCMGK